MGNVPSIDSFKIQAIKDRFFLKKLIHLLLKINSNKTWFSKPFY